MPKKIDIYLRMRKNGEAILYKGKGERYLPEEFSDEKTALGILHTVDELNKINYWNVINLYTGMTVSDSFIHTKKKALESFEESHERYKEFIEEHKWKDFFNKEHEKLLELIKAMES